MDFIEELRNLSTNIVKQTMMEQLEAPSEDFVRFFLSFV